MNIHCLKRKIQMEFSRIPLLAVLISAGIALCAGILIAISGGARHPSFYYYLPKGLLPIFFMGVFWSVFYALLGALIGIFLFSRSDFGKTNRTYIFFLLLCTLVLSYTWFPIVYHAKALFLGLLLCFLLFFCLFFLWKFFWCRSFFIFCGLFLFSFWMLYVFYYTFSLFLLNGAFFVE